MTPTDVERSRALRLAADPDIDQSIADLLVLLALPHTPAGARWAAQSNLRGIAQRIRDLHCGEPSALICQAGEDDDEAADREILGLTCELGQTVERAVEREGDRARFAAFAAAEERPHAWPQPRVGGTWATS